MPDDTAFCFNFNRGQAFAVGAQATGREAFDAEAVAQPRAGSKR